MKSINQKAPVQCCQSVVINTTRERVWQLLTQIDKWSDWQKEITRASLNGSLVAGSTFDWKTGGAKIRSTLHTVEPYTQFGWTGTTWGMVAIHNWILTNEGGSTTVTVAESMDGLLATIFKNSFNRSLATGMQYWLSSLKVECEKQQS